MIVSTAIAVLPVCRSPRISSRWPRPIGIRVSMTLSPVSSGTVTGRRSIISAELRSTGRRSWVGNGPSSSRGRPVGSTTRPISSAPTGTSRTAPLRCTSSPERRCRYSPSSTVPISFSSTVNASPGVPPGKNSTSSLPTPGSPVTRAIPLPREATCPISWLFRPGMTASMPRSRAAKVSSSARSRAFSVACMSLPRNCG